MRGTNFGRVGKRAATGVGGPWRVDRNMSGKGAIGYSVALLRRIAREKRHALH
jgi:hypothetical protein